MRFRTRLMLAFGSVAIITLGVSALGYWQASRLGSALYEVGVVRLPSITGLDMMWKAKAELDASARTLSMSSLPDSAFSAELERQKRAWERADLGWKTYEPLPQTAEEAATWRAFVPAWNTWKTKYDSSMSAAVRTRAASNQGVQVSVRAPENAVNDLATDVDRLLAKLGTINEDITNTAKAHSVASYADLKLLRFVMLGAGLFSVFGAIFFGYFMGIHVSAPLVKLAAIVPTLLDKREPVNTPDGADLEVSEIVGAMNELIARQSAIEEERNQATEALKKSSERFSKVFQLAPVGISVTGLSDGTIVETNEEFLKLLGYQRGEVIGRTSVELGVWPKAGDREAFVAPLSTAEEAFREMQLRAKSGELRTVRAASHIVEFDGQQFVVTAVADVTDQRRAELELRRSEQLYRELVEGVRDVIVAMTPQGILTSLNPAFEQVLGMPRDEWIGKHFIGLLVPEDKPQAMQLLAAVLANETRPIKQVRIITAEGKVRVGEVFLTAQRENDVIVGVLGIARDITDRVHLEEQFRQAQKMEAVGRLAGGVAHDFNNLLTVISGYGSMLMEELEADDPKRADVEQIMRASATAASLTRQLLAFSRRQVLQPKVLNLNEVVVSAEKLLKRLIGEDVRLVTTLAHDTGNIRADAGQLEQTIMNLAVNARDAMPHGGTLTLITGNVDASDERVHGQLDAVQGSYVMLSVSDSGVGMDEQTRDRIFEPFFTTKDAGKGTGLGLATVFGIVRQSKGLIRVNSAPGRGSTFEIFLPQVNDVVESASVLLDVAHGKETVLVVEDEPAVRAIVRQSLERQGYHVLEAPDGQTAMGLAARHHGIIDLLLTDVVMLGMSGSELSQRLTALRPDLRTLFMSGYTGEVVMDRDILERSSAYVQKPFTPDDIARTVRKALDA